MIYEIMTILPSQYADTEIDGVLATVTKQIEGSGAKVEKTHNYGKLKIAYPIERQRHGTYVLFYVSAESEMLPKLDQNLRLSEEVIRHLTIARPEGIPTKEVTLVQYTPPLTPEGRRAGEREERSQASHRPNVEVAAKVTTEELANKLDQILDSDIMKNI